MRQLIKFGEVKPTCINFSSRFWRVIILGALAALGPLSIDMYLPALPKLASELNATTSITQLSLTACLLGLAIGQLVAGPISDVRGRRLPLIVGVAIYAIVFLAYIIGGIAAPIVGINGTRTILPLAIVITFLVIAAVICFFFYLRELILKYKIVNVFSFSLIWLI